VLGKHTDYAGGSSLLVATDRGFTLTAEPLAGREIVVVADAPGEESGAEARWPLPHRPAPAPGPSPRPGWARYVDAVLQRLMDDGFGDDLRGARLTFRSTLPAAAGLSTSSALMTGIFLTLDAVCGLSTSPAFRAAIPHREALAEWLAAAERGDAVGTRGGGEDHAAVLCARAGRVVRYGMAPVRFRGDAPVPDGWTFAVAASGVTADKAGAARAQFNRLSDDAREAARAWAMAQDPPAPPPPTARDPRAAAAPAPAPPLDLARALAEAGGAEALLDGVRLGAQTLRLDPEPLVRRARHFAEESALVDAAFEALERSDLDAFAAAVARSVEAGVDLLGNQVPETLALTALARELGAAAASPFGAGFGGSVWALVRESDARIFSDAWAERYTDRVGRASDTASASVFFTTPAAGPAYPVAL